MPKVKIIGAGSAGNHFTHAFRKKGWQVRLTDCDPKALERTQSETYPQRYGPWDSSIELALDKPTQDRFDVVVIATPPETHSEIALRTLKESAPAILLIEKPLAHPYDAQLASVNTLARQNQVRLLVGYNHNLSPSLKLVREMLQARKIGSVYNVEVDVRENSQFILGAHPWLPSINESYLGDLARGGGAAFEHSHGVAMWMLLAEAAELIPVVKVNALSSRDDKMDLVTRFSFTNDRGYCGSVTQDFLASPPLKRAEIFGTQGRISWSNVFKANHEEVIFCDREQIVRHTFPKQRETDFVLEVEHLEHLLTNPQAESLIDWERGHQVYEILNTSVDAYVE